MEREIESDNFVYVNSEKIEAAFKGTNFGQTSNVEILRYAVLKSACGYHNGHTAQSIVVALGLVSKKGTVTKKGKIFLWEEFGKRGM